MQSFTFYSPTEIVFGRGAQEQTAQKVKKYGGTRVFLLYGGGSVRKSGLLGEVEKTLADAGIEFRSLGGVQPNPRLAFAEEAAKEASRFGADFILGVGGGSVLDTAKAVAHGVANSDVPLWSFWTREAPLEKTLPVGAVLTISAAGSETSDSAVLTNEAAGQKRGLSTNLNRPRFAIMNPELTFTLPPYQIGCGIVDIMMHTLDRYFTPTRGNALTDEWAEALLRVVIENGTRALEDPHDYDAMSELMWCGSLSHNGLTGLGAKMDFAVHQLGHELSAKFDVAHGASLSTVWGDWAREVCGEHPERFTRYAKNVWGAASAEEGIEATVRYFRSIAMPTCFTELGIGVQTEETVADLVRRCCWDDKRTIGSFKVLGREEIARIYTAANR